MDDIIESYLKTISQKDIQKNLNMGDRIFMNNIICKLDKRLKEIKNRK